VGVVSSFLPSVILVSWSESRVSFWLSGFFFCCAFWFRFLCVRWPVWLLLLESVMSWRCEASDDELDDELADELDDDLSAPDSGSGFDFEFLDFLLWCADLRVALFLRSLDFWSRSLSCF
jgi:hypothetical protein